MSAELLREAAALMRHRAEGVTPGSWDCYGDDLIWPSSKGPAANDPIAGVSQAHEGAAEHIASWHPAVALAVADWLDHEAQIADEDAEDGYSMGPNYPGLVLARAYLGSAS